MIRLMCHNPIFRGIYQRSCKKSKNGIFGMYKGFFGILFAHLDFKIALIVGRRMIVNQNPFRKIVNSIFSTYNSKIEY